MKLSRLHLEAEEQKNPGSEKDEGTPAHKAIKDAGGIKKVREKTGLSGSMLSHLRKPPKGPEGDTDHRYASAKTLAALKAAGVDIDKLLPKVGK
jgi:hypothetical protein